MASPQCEDGYTRIANEILEELSRTKLSGYEFRILVILFRYTYGWKGRKEAPLSAAFLAKKTSIDRRHVQRTLKKLENRQIISAKKGAGLRLNYCFNKHYNEWKIAPKMAHLSTAPKMAPAPAPNMALKPAPKMAHHKESNKESNKESAGPAGPNDGPPTGLTDNANKVTETLKAIREQERWKKLKIFQ